MERRIRRQRMMQIERDAVSRHIVDNEHPGSERSHERAHAASQH
jgi:hypothetical protein